MGTFGDSVRRHVLVSYDIADEKRLKKVQKLVSDAADRVQFSVYLGQFSAKDLVILRERLREVIHHQQDQVLFLDLGRVPDGDLESGDLAISHLGRPWEPRVLATMIY